MVKKFAFNPRHTVVAKHEDLGFEERASHDDPEVAHEQVVKKLVNRYKDNDERHGLISSKEARELVRFDSKVGTLKWRYLKQDE